MHLEKHRRLKGYKYFSEAIYLIEQNNELKYQIMNTYNIIGRKHGVSADSVRFAIARYIKKIDHRKPSEYISYYIERKL